LQWKSNKCYIFRVCVFSRKYPACKTHIFCVILYCHLWPVWLYYVFPHYLINSKIIQNTLINIKCVFWLYLQIIYGAFIILRIQRYIFINLHWSSCKVPLILVRFYWNLNFLDRFSKSPQLSNFIKSLLCGLSSMRIYGQTDRQTDIMKLILAFRRFTNAPKSRSLPTRSFGLFCTPTAFFF
jgi:hypothetical protein